MKTIPRHIKYLDRMYEIISSMKEPVLFIKEYRDKNEDKILVTAINREGVCLYVYDGYRNKKYADLINEIWKKS